MRWFIWAKSWVCPEAWIVILCSYWFTCSAWPSK